MEILGKVVDHLKEETGQSARGSWKKSGFVIETDGSHPKKIAIECWGQQSEEASMLRVGDTVKSHVNIESREHNGRWYTSVKAWKIESTF